MLLEEHATYDDLVGRCDLIWLWFSGSQRRGSVELADSLVRLTPGAARSSCASSPSDKNCVPFGEKRLDCLLVVGSSVAGTLKSSGQLQDRIETSVQALP